MSTVVVKKNKWENQCIKKKFRRKGLDSSGRYFQKATKHSNSSHSRRHQRGSCARTKRVVNMIDSKAICNNLTKNYYDINDCTDNITDFSVKYNVIQIWVCNKCTYRNIERLHYCAMCNNSYSLNKTTKINNNKSNQLNGQNITLNDFTSIKIKNELYTHKMDKNKKNKQKLNNKYKWKLNTSKSKIMASISNETLLQPKQIKCEYMFPRDVLKRLIKIYKNYSDNEMSVIYTFDNICNKKDMFSDTNSGVIFDNFIIKYYGITSFIFSLCRQYNISVDVISLIILYLNINQKEYTNYRYAFIDKLNHQTAIINQQIDYKNHTLKSLYPMSNLSIIQQRLLKKLNHTLFICLIIKSKENVTLNNILPIYRIQFKTQSLMSFMSNYNKAISYFPMQQMKHTLSLNVEQVFKKHKSKLYIKLKKRLSMHNMFKYSYWYITYNTYRLYTNKCKQSHCKNFKEKRSRKEFERDYGGFFWQGVKQTYGRVVTRHYYVKNEYSDALCSYCEAKQNAQRQMLEWKASFPLRIEMKGFPVKCNRNLNSNRYIQRKWSAYHKLNYATKFVVSHYTKD